jgi:hypothetical protein
MPAGKVRDLAGRALGDLPEDMSPGARQVAMLTAHRAAQAALLEPIHQALKELEAMPDWSGSVLVAGSGRFDWRTALIKRYDSFQDFYQQELAETWGKWSDLQETYRARVAGEIDDGEVQRRLNGNGGVRLPLHKRGDQSYNVTLNDRQVKQRGNTLAYRDAKAARDGKPATYYREKTLTVLRRAWRRASPEDRAAFRAEIERDP